MALIRTPKNSILPKIYGKVGKGENVFQHLAARRSTPMMPSSCAKPSLWLRVESVTLAPTKKGGKSRILLMSFMLVDTPDESLCGDGDVCVFFPQQLRPLKPIQVLQSCWTSRLVLNRFHLFIGPLKVVVSIQPRLCWRSLEIQTEMDGKERPKCICSN